MYAVSMSLFQMFIRVSFFICAYVVCGIFQKTENGMDWKGMDGIIASTSVH